MSINSFDARADLEVGGTTYEIFALDKVKGADTLPFSLKVLLENLLRTEDGANITAAPTRTAALIRVMMCMSSKVPATQFMAASANGSTCGAPAARSTRAAIVSVHPVSVTSSTSNTGPPGRSSAGSCHEPCRAATR